MWPAPTAEDWKKPCLVQWQRTWADAQAVSKETGKPIMVCINMDGEIASEHYAGVRYRQPEKAALYEPYVCVIASVYRHSPRDFDDQGRRVLCPRFGTVTCGEHIAIEPGLHEKFMDGQRIAPRHIGVELDGKEMYDVYYRWDTDSVFDAIRDAITNRPKQAPPVVQGDRSLVERVASPDAKDRAAVEAAYVQGDPALQRSLLEAAIARGDQAPVDLLRLGVFGLDVELSRMSRRALAASRAPEATDLIGEALRVPMPVTERDALIGALARIGETSPRARTLATVHQGLSGRSKAVDVDGWAGALGPSGDAPRVSALAPAVVEERLAKRDEVLQGTDATALLELSEAFLAQAVDRLGHVETFPGRSLRLRTDEKFAHALFLDARRTALQAEKRGAFGWRVSSVLALSAYYLGDLAEADRRVEAAAAVIPPDAPGWNAMAVLALFAEARWEAVLKAQREKKPWPAQWLTDVHAAYSVLARHPFGTDSQAAMHYDILKWTNAHGQAARVLDEAILRYPDSWLLHERLRNRVLAEKGVEGLEPAYEALLRKADAHPNLEWYAGYASLLTAEYHRRSAREAPSLEAYDRALAHFDRSIERNPDNRETADHYAAIALAGRARMAFRKKDWERCVNELLAAFARKPGSAASEDGLGLSAVATAQMTLARLREAKRTDLIAKLDAALDRLDPRLLEPPDWERDVPGAGRRPARAQDR
jgi:tetratricopeptide (TPR) repeat protein